MDLHLASDPDTSACFRGMVVDPLRLRSLSRIDKVSCDRFKIAQVIRNFLSNAIKFTPGGGTVVVSACFIAGDSSQTGANSGGGARSAIRRISGMSVSDMSVSGKSVTDRRVSAKPVGTAKSTRSGRSLRQLVCGVLEMPIAATNSGVDVDVESGLATGAGGEAGGVAAADVCDGYLRVTVKDSGVGLTEADQQKLFKEAVQFRYSIITVTAITTAANIPSTSPMSLRAAFPCLSISFTRKDEHTCMHSYSYIPHTSVLTHPASFFSSLTPPQARSAPSRRR